MGSPAPNVHLLRMLHSLSPGAFVGKQRLSHHRVLRCVRIPGETDTSLSVLGNRNKQLPCGWLHRVASLGKGGCAQEHNSPGLGLAQAGLEAAPGLRWREGLPVSVCCKNIDACPTQTGLCVPWEGALCDGSIQTPPFVVHA